MSKVIAVILEKTIITCENILHITDPTPSLTYKTLWTHFKKQLTAVMHNDPKVKNNGESSSSSFYLSSLYFP
jgi:hypothetical protein